MNLIKDLFSIKMIARNALVASLYAVLTIISSPLSYGFMQIRFSEALNILTFFNPNYTLGLTIGCLLANLFSSAGMYDVILGTLTTLVSSIIFSLLGKLTKNMLFPSFIPSIANAFVVPLIIYLASLGTSEEFSLDISYYFYMVGFVFLGEFISINIIGYILFLSLSKKYKDFNNLINSTQNLTYRF